MSVRPGPPIDDALARPLRGCDAGFLYMETPTQPTGMGTLAILGPRRDGQPSGRLTPARLRAHVAQLLPTLPLLRWRLVRAPLGLHRPYLIDDPAFDLDHHLGHETLPAPGGAAELDQVVARATERVLDRSRPLWYLDLVDGLAGGQQAILVTLHHALADGAAMKGLAGLLFNDPPGDDAARTAVNRPRPVTRGALLGTALAGQWADLRRLPPLVADTRRRIGELKAREAESTVAVPAMGSDTPVCSINDAFSGRRRYAHGTVALADLRRVRQAADVTLASVFLALVAGSLRDYLARRGDLPRRPLTANIPVGTDHPDGPQRVWGDAFANHLVTLATDEADPWARLHRIHEVADESRQRLEILGVDTIVRWLDYVPAAVGDHAGERMSRWRREHPDRIDFNVLVSNMRGPTETLAFGPVQVDHMYMWGPTTDGEGINLSAWSYRDELGLAIVAHAEAVEDPQELMDGLVRSLDELVVLADEHERGDRGRILDP